MSFIIILIPVSSETTSIPTNPRTTRPVGYAFVDLSTAEEAQKAINELAGKVILERKVSVQLARKPESQEQKQAAATSGAEGSGGEGNRRRGSGRTRGRGGRGRGGRQGRGGRSVSNLARTVTILSNTTFTGQGRGRAYQRSRPSGTIDRDIQRSYRRGYHQWSRSQATYSSTATTRTP